MGLQKKEEDQYFHIVINEKSPLIKKLKLAKIHLDCLTMEELIQKLWDIATKIEPVVRKVNREAKKC